MTIDIDIDAARLTLINTFSVAAGDNAGLIAELRRFTEQHARYLPGFVGTAVHGSEDSTRVVNYVQWRSAAALDVMLGTPEAREHLRTVAAMAERIDPVRYNVAFVRGRCEFASVD